MKKTHTLLILLIVSVFFTACKKESLQNYLVEAQNKNEFIYADLPAGIIQLNADDISEADKKAYESIKKVNFAGLLHKKAKEGQLDAEVAKLKSIFKNTDYKKLMNANVKGNHVTVYYLGQADAINEVVAFAYRKETGVGVVRLLGERMNPNAIIKMLKSAKVNSDNVSLSKFKMIFNENNSMKTTREERIKKLKEIQKKVKEKDEKSGE